ncbi:sensor histidine kinase [Streptomonospora wellingtoniae]|uniref:histidine kinase n=1 Tax=Streptomonospora wellingtoniae TaxID=3075544 RepID=A0ABU2KXT2_9ACTN|nr:ATP-binding protein [Streptomonospora sp. DSM 45055]MDT0304053.1 ATP-binding protein [Streptomonospora sp. DSM 45055]
MSARVSERNQSQRSPNSPGLQAVLVFCAAGVVLAAAWYWVVSAVPGDARVLMIAVGSVMGVLLAGAVAVATYHAAAAAMSRDRAARAEERVAQAEHKTAGLEQELRQFAHDGVPDLRRRIRQGATTDAAIADSAQPNQEALRTLLVQLGQTLGQAERRGAAAMAACAGAAARVQAQVTNLLAQLRELEDRYGDQDGVFGDLLELDHQVSQMGRLADSFALLSGGRSGRRWTKPIVMESILRGAMGRIYAFRRVRIHSTSSAAVVGYAAEGVMQALAELMDNAANFSAHNTEVHVYVEEEDTGVMVTVEDSGLGMRPRERRRADQLVSQPHDLTNLPGSRMGLAVVGRVSAKYGLTVNFRPSSRGGTGAVVLIPQHLVTRPRQGLDAPAAPPPPPRTTEPAAVAASSPPASAIGGGSAGDTDEPLLPKRRRGQTLAEAQRQQSQPRTERTRERGDPGTRFAAFRKSARGRDSASDDTTR